MVPKLFQSFEDNKPNASLPRIFVFNVELLKYWLANERTRGTTVTVPGSVENFLLPQELARHFRGLPLVAVNGIVKPAHFFDVQNPPQLLQHVS
jgi:hypothetical protein